MVDGCQFGKRQVVDTRPRVDQDVVVDEHRCGSQMAPANAAATAQNPDFHAGSTGFRCCPLLTHCRQSPPTNDCTRLTRRRLPISSSGRIPSSRQQSRLQVMVFEAPSLSVDNLAVQQREVRCLRHG
jgi:hypothetical protein